MNELEKLCTSCASSKLIVIVVTPPGVVTEALPSSGGPVRSVSICDMSMSPGATPGSAITTDDSSSVASPVATENPIMLFSESSEIVVIATGASLVTIPAAAPLSESSAGRSAGTAGEIAPNEAIGTTAPPVTVIENSVVFVTMLSAFSGSSPLRETSAVVTEIDPVTSPSRPAGISTCKAAIAAS